MSVYTLGIWWALPGHEAQFVDAWSELARRTAQDHPEATAVLLQDRDRPTMFVSSGPWESDEAVAAWRASPAFQESVAGLREHLERFEPHTMDPVRVVPLVSPGVAGADPVGERVTGIEPA